MEMGREYDWRMTSTLTPILRDRNRERMPAA
jgi:hypothetical protein